MPEFILDHGSADGSRAFEELDSFTQGYVEAMFFTSTGTGDDGELEDATVAELTPETLGVIRGACAQFQSEESTLLEAAYSRDDYSQEQAGRDFWYTRNGHGCGFWDREALEANCLGDKLADAARQWGERYLYRGDDGLLYLD